MSKYRSKQDLNNDRVSFDDLMLIEELCKSMKLTERERLAILRLYRTYQFMVD